MSNVELLKSLQAALVDVGLALVVVEKCMREAQNTSFRCEDRIRVIQGVLNSILQELHLALNSPPTV
jgi:hypothetical protein